MDVIDFDRLIRDCEATEKESFTLSELIKMARDCRVDSVYAVTEIKDDDRISIESVYYERTDAEYLCDRYCKSAPWNNYGIIELEVG